MLSSTEIFLLLLVAICLIAAFARKINLSYPIGCVIGGMILALIPGFPEFQIPPHLILLIFLPVLLTETAYLTSVRDFKQNLRNISSLAVGLVVFTAVAVAFAMQWLFPGSGWAVGMVLGAIVSPPDAVAAASVIKNLKVPKRIITILEGESLVNDATGLVMYKFAVVAVMVGTFSLPQASGHFLWMVVSGVTIGWLAAQVYIRLFRHIKEQSVEILSTFLLPYAVYIATEEINGSGVLAVVTSGIVTGWLAPKHFSANFRLQSTAVWKMVVFVMNGLVFLLIGLYFPSLAFRLSYISTSTLVKSAIIICTVVVITRFLWVYIVGYGQIYVMRRFKTPIVYPAWQNVFIVAFTGMRGVVSLATALALPLVTSSGAAFPYRDLIIFLAFAVILVTLVMPGLILPYLVRKLSLRFDPQVTYENWLARKESAYSALKKLTEIAAAKDEISAAALKRIISHYNDKILSLGDGPNTPLNKTDAPLTEVHPIIEAENKIWQEVLEVERKTILRMRQNFEIGDEVMHELLRDIDLLDNRFTSN